MGTSKLEKPGNQNTFSTDSKVELIGELTIFHDSNITSLGRTGNWYMNFLVAPISRVAIDTKSLVISSEEHGIVLALLISKADAVNTKLGTRINRAVVKVPNSVGVDVMSRL